MTIEEKIKAIEGYPIGRYLYKQLIEHVYYYYFEFWIATDKFIDERFAWYLEGLELE